MCRRSRFFQAFRSLGTITGDALFRKVVIQSFHPVVQTLRKASASCSFETKSFVLVDDGQLCKPLNEATSGVTLRNAVVKSAPWMVSPTLAAAEDSGWEADSCLGVSVRPDG